jgi:hypothetical protein
VFIFQNFFGTGGFEGGLEPESAKPPDVLRHDKNWKKIDAPRLLFIIYYIQFGLVCLNFNDCASGARHR